MCTNGHKRSLGQSGTLLAFLTDQGCNSLNNSQAQRHFLGWAKELNRANSTSMPHTTAHCDGGAWPGSSSLAEQEHTRLQGEASTPYDAASGAHLSLLRALWVSAGLGPADEFEPVSTRWLGIGFQGVPIEKRLVDR